MQKPLTNDVLSRKVLAAYGGLAFPLAAAFIALQVIVPTYYAEFTQLSLTSIGVILLLARLTDTLTDPVVGILSDRTHSRFGRRRSFVLLAAPLVCVACWFLFNPHADAGAVWLFCWATAIYAAGTLFVVPLNAWGAELSGDYHQRSRVTGARAAFGLLGTLVALGLPALLVETGTDVHATDSLTASLDTISWLVIVSLGIALLFAMTLVPDNSKISLPDNTWTSTLQLLRKRSPMRQLISSFLLNGIANAIPATLFLFYLDQVIQAPQAAGGLLLVYFSCSALSIPLWVRVAKRYGKHQTWQAAMALACCFFVWVPFLGAGDLWLYALLVVATGFLVGADLTLPTAIKGDLIEWDALNTGLRRPGLFFALWGTANKMASALAIGIAFPLLQLMGFDAKEENSPDALLSLALIYCLPCILLKAMAIWGMHRYPITAAEHNRIRKSLAEQEDN